MEVTDAGTAKNGEQYCGAGSSVGTALNSRDALLQLLCYSSVTNSGFSFVSNHLLLSPDIFHFYYL